MKPNSVVTAKELLISLASRLPENLQLDQMSEEYQFTKDFLLRLNEVQLSNLKNEAKKHDDKNICLLFYVIPESKAGKVPSQEVKDFTNFDFSKVVKIYFNGDTAPLLKHSDSEPKYYVSVTLVLQQD